MSKSDRESAFGKTESGYLWCLHCERAYNRNEIRTVVDNDGFIIEICHYTDCDAWVDIDGWDWEKIREMHPEYPIKPETGKHYPMYGKKQL